ncbi:MAG: class I SAM-dependent methyltransferase [Proteobacteria bacterium]|nr:class I SAM-dependent methyltransferase [Pseudomonadota bacterium]
MPRQRNAVPTFKRLLLPFVLACQLIAPAHADNALQHWIDGPQRSEKNRQRDPARQPAATLEFFDIKPGQTVVEIWPSVGAWWFEILAPYLRDHGHYIAALHAGEHNPAAARAEHDAIGGLIASQATLYGQVELALSPGLTTTLKPDSVDLLLTFMNLHNWITDGNADAVIREFHAVLKPGGVLGVVDHRARTDRPSAEQLQAGYLREDEVIARIEKAGFKLVARSEIAANPLDTKDHPAGVWTLPPTLRLKDQDRAHYLAIGESDKFTLKFIKAGNR